MRAYERFLHYVTFDTQSDSKSDTVPSTLKQRELGRVLADELKALGLADAELDESGYVYASLPATPGYEDAPALALISHMDTAPEVSGANVKARIVERYDGGDILLNEELGIVSRPSEFPDLLRYVGEDLIVTDGTTLLGGDNKAGVAEIVTMVERLVENPALPHPAVRIAFTPDEEIGRSPDHFRLDRLNAAYGYTVDGGAVGDIQYENFNSARANVTIHGVAAHSGYAKNIMKNAVMIAMEFASMLPAGETPDRTEHYEGFFHVLELDGKVDAAAMRIAIAEFDSDRFAARKELTRQIAAFLNHKYGEGTVEVELVDRFYNMREPVKLHMHLIENAAEALRRIGAEPVILPVRGGTDGCRLSYMGLPCPNLCVGGHYGHSLHEFISIQSMDQVVDMLVQLVQLYAK